MNIEPVEMDIEPVEMDIEPVEMDIEPVEMAIGTFESTFLFISLFNAKNMKKIITIFFILIFHFFSNAENSQLKIQMKSYLANLSSLTWVPVSNLQFNMNVIAKIQLSQGVYSVNSNDIIGAFAGSECRGIASPLSSLNGILFLTIGSNSISGELIHFKLIRSAYNDTINLNESIIFNSSQELGTMGNPYIFTFNTPCLLTVFPLNSNIPSAAGSINFQLTTNCNWTATADQSWCTVTASGSGNSILSATYNNNSGNSSRMVHITIQTQSTSTVITLTQSGNVNSPNWVPATNQQYNMNVVGKIQLFQGVFSLDSSDLIGAFVGNECRGIASPYPNYGGLFFLTVQSNIQSGENITFKIFRPSTNIIYNPAQTLAFQNLSDTGGLNNPFILKIDNTIEKKLLITAFLEGLYNGMSGMNTAYDENGIPQWGDSIADKMVVELRNTNSVLIKSYNADLKINGIIDISLEDQYSDSYYIVLKNRNHIETWSSLPISFVNNFIIYNFTTSASKAYGDNQKEVAPGIFAIFAGDVNQDGLVDGSDMSDSEVDNNNFISGYLPTDVNGDGLVDGSDMSIVETANNNFVGIVIP